MKYVWILLLGYFLAYCSIPSRITTDTGIVTEKGLDTTVTGYWYYYHVDMIRLDKNGNGDGSFSRERFVFFSGKEFAVGDTIHFCAK